MFERVIEHGRPQSESNPPQSEFDVNILLTAPVDDLDQDEVLKLIQAIGQAQAVLDAVRLRALDRFSRLSGDDASARRLLASVEKISPAKAGIDLALARDLSSRLPSVFAALAAGLLRGDRVVQVARATRALSPAHCREVDQALLPSACEKTPSQLSHLLRVLIAQADPAGAARQADKRKAERRVSVGRGSGGMSWLRALLTADDTIAVYARLDAVAHDVRDSGDRRTLDQLRADTVRDLLLGKMSSRVITHVYVPSDRSDRPSGSAVAADMGQARRSGSHRSARMSPSGARAGRRGARKNKANRGR